jgi:hypothetical protein
MSGPMLIVRAPPHRRPEFGWVCDVVFGRWLGLAFRIETHDVPRVVVDTGTGQVEWAETFFAQADGRWLAAESLPPDLPASWPVPDAQLRERVGQASMAQVFGDGRFDAQPGCVHLPIDITGSVFFMLSRYEEAAVGAPADRHGRFPGSASLAHRAGLALRPLVDEWVELLWWALQRVAPGLARRPRTPRVWVSCDVDAPYSPGAKSLALALRQSASHLVHERSPKLAAQALLNAAAERVGVTRFDPFDTFDWMLGLNERASNRVTFFFLSVTNPQRIDGCYELSEARIASLIGRMVERGHEIGLHGSYGSVDEPSRIAAELDGLQRALHLAGGTQAEFGGRQHYLRWRTNDTARALSALGLAYDSTLGFPDIAGFRCGTCHAYPMFDLQERRALSLLQRPLVLMEVTVTSSTYLNLGHGDEALALMMGLRDSCRRFGGEFALLWHNSNFVNPRAREMYETLIQPLR